MGLSYPLVAPCLLATFAGYLYVTQCAEKQTSCYCQPCFRHHLAAHHARRFAPHAYSRSWHAPYGALPMETGAVVVTLHVMILNH